MNAKFGNVRAVLELSSVANQLGRKRTLCEAYGAGGWDLRFEDMKRIGDWLYVRVLQLDGGAAWTSPWFFVDEGEISGRFSPTPTVSGAERPAS